MKNGQLKRSYNVQVGTENQFILGYTPHQRPTDTRCLIPHLKRVKDRLGKLPRAIIADAGYGDEKNYAYLEKEELDGIVKYNTFCKAQSKAWKNDRSRVENWQYDAQQDA